MFIWKVSSKFSAKIKKRIFNCKTSQVFQTPEICRTFNGKYQYFQDLIVLFKFSTINNTTFKHQILPGTEIYIFININQKKKWKSILKKFHENKIIFQY